MNEIQRMLAVRINLMRPLRIPLQNALGITLHMAKTQREVAGMVKAVEDGYKSWDQEIRGQGMAADQGSHDFARALLVAVPDLFIVAYQAKAFKDFKMNADEQVVFEECKALFDARVQAAELFSKTRPDWQEGTDAARYQVLSDTMALVKSGRLTRDYAT